MVVLVPPRGTLLDRPSLKRDIIPAFLFQTIIRDRAVACFLTAFRTGGRLEILTTNVEGPAEPSYIYI